MLKGIDISRYQNGINISNLDIDFVIVKITEGVGYSDPNYKEFLNQALKSNKKIGLYHYARPDLNNTPEDEATWFVSKAKDYIKQAILVLDWEVDTNKTDWAYNFLKTVYEKTKVRPIIYMSAYPANTYNWTKVVNGNFGLWIASYGANTGAPGAPPTNKYWPFYILWQYTSKGYEPTNHLDLESITSLNKGMSNFKGEILFTSRDYELNSTVSNRVIEILDDGKIIDRSIPYEEYLERK